MSAAAAATTRSRLVFSPDSGTWSWEVDGALLLACCRSGAVAPGQAPVPVEPSGTSSIEDACGRARVLELAGASREGLTCRIRLALYDDGPFLAIDGEVVNGTGDDAPLAEFLFVEGRLDLGPSCPDIAVRGPGTWMGDGGLWPAGEEATASWVAAVADRGSGSGLVAGIAEPANVDDAISVRRRGPEHLLRFTGTCASNRAGRPLLLRPGSAFRPNRVVLVPTPDVQAGFERYAGFLRRNARLAVPRGPYAGLFTAYSSDPANRTVLRLTEAKVREQLDVLERTVGGYGVEYVKIEFGVCGSPGLIDAAQGMGREPAAILPREYRLHDHFPGGIRALVDEIHRRGFKAALQSRTFLYVPGGTHGEDEATAAIYRRAVEEWGFDYLMLDFNSTDCDNADPTRTVAEVVRDRFRAVRAAAGARVLIEACMAPLGPVIGAVDGFRPATDFRGGEEDAMLPDFASCAPLHGSIVQLDTEFYDASIRPFVWGATPVVAPREGVRSWVSLCALLGFSFLAGGDLAGTSAERVHILSRALPVLGTGARSPDLMRERLPRRWVLAPGSRSCAERVAGLFNWSYERDERIDLDLAACGFPGDLPVLVFDFWARQLLGAYCGTFSALLPPRGCRVLFLNRVPDRPAVVASDRHVTGAFSCEEFAWDEPTLTMSGTSSGPQGTGHSLFVYLPRPRGPKAWSGCAVEMAERRLLEVRVSFAQRGRIAWSVELDPDAVVR